MSFRRALSLVAAVLGTILVFGSVYPLLYYEWQSELKYPVLLSPLSSGESEKYKFVKRDYTKSESWFDTKKEENSFKYKTPYYTLSVPKLKIDNAIVRVDNDDLSQNLVQFSGSSEPGKRGNTVIFGHSVLPVFFNPKNYISIFSTLYKLNRGDEVIINYEDITYKYIVESMFEVRPTDIEVLEQNSDTPYISLITCTPPGDPRKPRRLVVRAKIASPQNDI
jgi:sortase A